VPLPPALAPQSTHLCILQPLPLPPQRRGHRDREAQAEADAPHHAQCGQPHVVAGVARVSGVLVPVACRRASHERALPPNLKGHLVCGLALEARDAGVKHGARENGDDGVGDLGAGGGMGVG
jgi:hypothetical protein